MVRTLHVTHAVTAMTAPTGGGPVGAAQEETCAVHLTRPRIERVHIEVWQPKVFYVQDF